MKKLFIFTALLILISDCFSQPLSPIIDSIPMRDGKKLAADIYIPTGVNLRPTILIQTPYNKYWYRYGLPIGIGINIDSLNYNFVIVDWRCFYGSSSACITTPNRGEDGFDAIDWIKDQTWSDGQIGTWGPSALGKIQFQTAREKHPNHVCAVPLVAGPQFEYNEYYPGGVYRKEYVDQLDALGYGMSTFLLSNPFYNTTWQWLENNNYYPSDIEIPLFMIGGWYDHNTDLMIDFFRAIRQSFPAPVNSEHKLLMGPWAHGGSGATQVGTEQQGELFYSKAAGWSDSLALMFFDYYLLNNNNGWDSNPVINYFQMGKNEWMSASDWPTTGLTNYNLYLTDNIELEINQPQNQTAYSTIIYDPRDPSPSYGGECMRQDLLQGPYNQADSVESRNDIAVFSTQALIQDVVLRGKPIVHLFVSSDRLDTDFAIRLTDVYPDGRSMLLAEGIKRMRFRNGYSTSDTASMNPGQIYEIEIELKNLAVTFLTGHSIRIDITSSNYPRFDNNLNNGQNMYTAGDTLIATNKIYHNSNYASYIEFSFIDYPQNVEEYSIQNNIKIYPNPTNNLLNVCFHLDKNETANIHLLNINGQYVSQYQLKQEKEGKIHKIIDISPLSAGVYMIRIITSNLVYNEKIIIK